MAAFVLLCLVISTLKQAGAAPGPSLAGHHSGSNTTFKEAATGQPRTDAATDQQHAAEREQQFLSWLSQEGASFESIRLGRSAAGLRGVFAAANLSKGDLLVAVPHHVILKLPYSSNDDFCEQGEALMLALLQRDPAHVAHLDVLPTLEESRMSPDTFHLPRSYWKLLQSEVAESFILNQRAALLQYWRRHQQRLQPLGASLELLRYTLWLTASRTFNYNETHFSLVPLVDMTNHVNGCPTVHSDKPCPNNPSETCFIIRAGAAIAAGNEVCNGYGYLRNDEAFLHYGFNLDEQQAAELLFVVDRHDASMEALAGVGYRAETRPPHFFRTRAALQAEQQRLQRRLQELQRGDAKAGSWPRALQDSSGVILQQLLQWRRLRQQAITNELARLHDALLELHTGGNDRSTASAAAQVQQRTARDEL
uniref:SET domain-containing protein n=1 Tax=Tetradesmus obliquus TaxID=3088 RepID=A0A383W8S8_TETOB|eukprot:jgi/Sobl393_1/2042/SZX73414.1